MEEKGGAKGGKGEGRGLKKERVATIVEKCKLEIRGSCDYSNKLPRDLNSTLQDSPLAPGPTQLYFSIVYTHYFYFY